jgi:hypothetical protein
MDLTRRKKKKKVKPEKPLQPPKPAEGQPVSLGDRIRQTKGRKKTYSDTMKELFPDER